MCVGSTPWEVLEKISSISIEQLKRQLGYMMTDECSVIVPFNCLKNGEHNVEVYLSGYPEINDKLCKECSNCKELIKIQNEKAL